MDTASRCRRSASTLGYPHHLRRRAEDRRQRPAASPTAARASARSRSTSRCRRARRRSTSPRWRKTSTKVFVLEVMGRHAGWIAAAGGLAGRRPDEPPHIILFPGDRLRRGEVPRARRSRCVERRTATAPSCVSEGVHDADGKFLAEAGTKDAFGHAQLGGVGAGGRATWCKRSARLQVPLGGRRLPAARRAPHRLEGRRRAGLRGRQGGGRARASRA